MGSAHQAYLSEVFSSIQGEGLLVGLRQIFVRFSGCSLTCDYCDTPESRVSSPGVHVSSLEPGVVITFPNPVSSEDLIEIVNSLNVHPNLHHSISLTGGEPLEQVDFLREWLPAFRKGSSVSPIKIYIETNGLLPADLSEIINLVDIVGMDMKLPSVAGVKPFWNLHRDFLKIASKRELFVKVVVSKKARMDEISEAAEIVSSVNPGIPFILQPQTPLDLNADELLNIQEIASRKLCNVRVIPQVHKLLNLK